MRRAPLLIALSLVANVALGVTLWWRISHAENPTSLLGVSSSPAATPRSAEASNSERWETISHAPDASAFAARLRAEGFPPEIVRALVSQRIYARFKPRLDALKQKAPPPKPYWQNRWWFDYDFDPATRAEQRALWRELEDEIKAVLGPDAEHRSAYRREQFARSYGPLPLEKISEIEAISRDYEEIAQSINDNARGVLLTSDRQKLAFLEKEKRADLVRLLTPEELEEYDRRNSPSAEEARAKLQYVQCTEDDFIKLFALQREFDERYGRDNLSGEEQDRRKAALPELDRQIEAALGPDRYAEFQVANDVNFSATRATLERIDLPPEKASDLVRIQRDAKTRAELIRRNEALTADQRSQQLLALQKEAVGKASTVLGTAENLDMFQRTAGQWLGKLVSRTNPDVK